MNNRINFFQTYRFCLNGAVSPTYFNLCKYLEKQGWQYTTKLWRAHLSEKHFAFDSTVAECLEFKHLLAALVGSYCPEVMPLTFYIDDSNWQSVLQDIDSSSTWILKPGMLNNGQHIKIFTDINQIEAHYLSPNRLSGPHVLQKYISSPHLLKGPVGGHKYSIRMFIVLTNYAGAYLFPQGYFNIAFHPYKMHQYQDMHSHITNEHLFADESNVLQIPTAQYELFRPFYPHIKSILEKVNNALQELYPYAFSQRKHPKFALLGFDFLIDNKEQVWLLEANHGPCFPTQESHPLQQTLYQHFWQALIESFIIPLGRNKIINPILFEKLE